MNYQRAVLTSFGSPDQIRVVSGQAPPQPRKNEVLVRIEASSVSATDTMIRKGLYPLLKEKPPFTLGYAFVGTVEKIGTQIKTIQAGERVADISQIGGNATHICRPAEGLLKVRRAVASEQAVGMVLSGMTAYQVFKHYLKVGPGSRVLIHGGAGAVGSTLLQLCKYHGVTSVTTASAAKHQFVRAYAEVVLDYRHPEYPEQLRRAGKEGFDAAVDFTSSASLRRSFQLLNRGGRLVSIGTQSVVKKAVKKNTLNFIRFGLSFARMMSQLTWWGWWPNDRSAYFFGIVDSKKNFPDRYQQDFDELCQLVEQGSLQPLVQRLFSLDQIGEIHQQLDESKIVGHAVIKN